jgi:hypothetical protein
VFGFLLNITLHWLSLSALQIFKIKRKYLISGFIAGFLACQVILLLESLSLIPFWLHPFIAQVLSFPILEELMKYIFIILYLNIWPLYDRDVVTIGITIGIGFSLRGSLLYAVDPVLVLGSLGTLVMHFVTGGLHGLGLYVRDRGKAFWFLLSLIAFLVHSLYSLYLFV